MEWAKLDKTRNFFLTAQRQIIEREIVLVKKELHSCFLL